MFDVMRDRIAFALICLVFIAIFGYIGVQFDGARGRVARFSILTRRGFCSCDRGAHDTRKFKAR